ncbi:MAG: response regulator transcription factor [Salibacteraceae bacterium]|nr:response regulator transcription factor [Salibacteraceae bacterium]MDP4764639.1 response regulator transcription factor [Salibacteraceae bacterium]MDP4843442.1 response regulator transcription factor [Salibacteraceae bacterium]MDP4933399.1 response regulator transcription factor [Salibacteraceae bacterium]MDP4965288.1 response regulator transcription factor [Salibacteraceae bacterium]
MKILIIEDETLLATDIEAYLNQSEYKCEFAPNISVAQDKLSNHEYDCVLLDLMLPDGSGLSVLESLKAKTRNEGIIVISAKNSIEDKVKCLELGADDYLAKPFHQAELAARIHSVIRRKKFSGNDLFRFNEIEINLQSKSVSVANSAISLTRKEFELLLFLISNKGRVLSKNALAEHLSGDFADMFDNHDFVYAHVKNLKHKLRQHHCDQYLKTVYGVGYKWEA